MTGAFAWTDHRVRAALGLAGEPTEGAAGSEGVGEASYGRVSTDSRTTREGDLFVALEGDSFDGHDYVAAALGQGARGAVVSRRVEVEGDAVVYPVDDTLRALGRLAGYRRAHLDAAVVGITGSSGKTGTKDLTRAALEGSRRLHATAGNFNNRVGLPLTLLAAPDDAEVLVLEMGTNEPGEIRILTEIAGPEIGVITTLSETHVEKLGSLEGVLEEKLDLLRGLPERGTAVVGDEPAILVRGARGVRPDVKVAGWSDRADADLQPDEATVDRHGHWSFLWRGERVRLRVPGRHTVVNALLALTVADLLEVPAAAAAEGVSAVEASSLRGEVRQLGGLTLLLDCYNANPQSTRAALDLLASIEPGRPKVAFLGSMLELGERSEALHAELLADAETLGLDVVVATGEFARAAKAMAARRSTSIAAADALEAYRLLKGRLSGDEVVLIKASRGVALERVIPEFERDFGVAGVSEA